MRDHCCSRNDHDDHDNDHDQRNRVYDRGVCKNCKEKKILNRARANSIFTYEGGCSKITGPSL